MPRKRPNVDGVKKQRSRANGVRGFSKIEYKNAAQKIAYSAFDQHDVLFMLGPAGCGKTLLAVAFAIGEVLSGRKDRIIISRPIVEAGESLGYLPGDLSEKTDPYMMPIFDSIYKLCGKNNPDREKVDAALEVTPLAYMRGRSFFDSICILDEAQNANKMQLKLFLTRFDENSKVIVTGDPKQSDLGGPTVDLMDVVRRLKTVPGIGVVEFPRDSIVRHPLVGSIVDALEGE